VRLLALMLVLMLAACSRDPAPPGRVLIVGVDGATLRIIEPLMAEDRLPHLAEIAQRGVGGPLRSIRPLLSPRIWNSIATGKRPGKHGIAKFAFEKDGVRQLYMSHHRKTHALWNIASDASKTVAVINWWNTQPPEKIRGVMVSDHASPARAEELRTLGAASDGVATVYPPEWEERVGTLLSDDAQIPGVSDPVQGLGELPSWASLDILSKRHREDLAVARVALAVEAELRPDLLLVLLPGVDRISHALWGVLESPEKYPRYLQPNEAQRETGKQALFAYYEFVDALIGRLAERYSEDDLIIVLSDHGFEAGVPKLGNLTGDHKSADAQLGIVFASGPGIRAGAPTDTLGVYDITPTVLAWWGLPVGEDMDGAVAPFLQVDALTTIASHDITPIERVSSAPSGADERILEDLRDLGYLE